MEIVKNILRRLFRFLGYDVYKIQKDPPNALGIPITSPIDHNTLEEIEELYSDDKFIKRYLAKGRLEFYKEIANYISSTGIILSNKTIADVGCGTGHLLLSLQKQFNCTNITGFEYSPEALKICKQTIPNARLKLYDIYTKPKEHFDAVFCTEVLEHLLYPDTALLNLLEMVNSNGFAFVTVPDGRKDTFEGHINFFSPESWEIFIQKNCENFIVDIGLLNLPQRINYALVIKK